MKEKKIVLGLQNRPPGGMFLAKRDAKRPNVFPVPVEKITYFLFEISSTELEKESIKKFNTTLFSLYGFWKSS
jgi:hypothetical protein